MFGGNPMDCPICRVKLEMSERQGIEIDYCPQCRGIWLDRGELDKIIDRTQSVFQAQNQELNSNPTYHEQQSYDYKPKKHKKKSFLEDLFDFD